jgi:hypothetical protein
VGIDVAYGKRKLFRDAVLLGRLLELLHQRGALLGQDAVGAWGSEQGYDGEPCPAQLQKLADPPARAVLQGFRHAFPSFDDRLRPLAQQDYFIGW